MLPVTPGDDREVAPAFAVFRDDAAIVTFVSGNRPEIKASTLEGNDKADAYVDVGLPL